MAVRLHMKLGVVAEHDRLDDSPDTLVIVEPSVGSVARSKGHLYLLVTSRISSRHALEATRLAAETIRNEYYYDESAGIRVCLQKAIATANKRLAHQADRLGLKSSDGNGPIGIGVAVVRGSEMYVATVGPAEAYLIRQARLSTLPDPHRERGPAVGRDRAGGLARRDLGRRFARPGVAQRRRQARGGRAQGRDADTPPAVGDGASPPPLRGRRRLGERRRDRLRGDRGVVDQPRPDARPGPPAEPLAGAPDRSPIPLADNVQAAGVAVSAAAGSARVAAGGAIERAVARLQDLMPRRKPAYRRVTPLASRRETQRRAALAILTLVIVVGVLGLGVYAFGGSTPQRAISSANAGQKALDQAKADLAKVSGSGIDLVTDDPNQALGLLTDAAQQLTIAEGANVSATVIAPLRAQAVAGLDRLYGVVPVASVAAVHVQGRRRCRTARPVRHGSRA